MTAPAGNYQTTSGKFNEQYAEAGMQPSVGVRKVAVDYKKEAANDPTMRRGGAANDNNYKAVSPTRPKESKRKEKLRAAASSNNTVRPKRGFVSRVAGITPAGKMAKLAGAAGKQAANESRASKKLARAKATRINMPIFAWGMSAWLFFQLPMGILSLVAFGMSALLYEIENTIRAAAESGSKIAQVFGIVASAIGDTLVAAGRAFKDITGIDLSLFHPDTLFFVTYAVIFAWGVLVLMLMYLLYKLAMLKPLGGKGSGFKMGMLLFCVVGYSMPILNLFPWHMLWATAVWIKPN